MRINDGEAAFLAFSPADGNPATTLELERIERSWPEFRRIRVETKNRVATLGFQVDQIGGVVVRFSDGTEIRFRGMVTSVFATPSSCLVDAVWVTIAVFGQEPTIVSRPIECPTVPG